MQFSTQYVLFSMFSEWGWKYMFKRTSRTDIFSTLSSSSFDKAMNHQDDDPVLPVCRKPENISHEVRYVEVIVG